MWLDRCSAPPLVPAHSTSLPSTSSSEILIRNKMRNKPKCMISTGKLICVHRMRYDNRKSFMKMQSIGSFEEIFSIYVVATWREEKRKQH